MSKKSDSLAYDVRARITAEAERDLAVAELQRRDALAAAAAAAPAAPPPPVVPPPTRWEQYRALAGNPAAEALYVLEHGVEMAREHAARGAR